MRRLLLEPLNVLCRHPELVKLLITTLPAIAKVINAVAKLLR